MRLASVSLALAAVLWATQANAQTAQTYVYDVQGRLTGVTSVVGSSTANVSGYNYDAVDNRDFRRTGSFNQPASTDQLASNEQMVLQQTLYSPDTQTRLVLQADGNLAVYCGSAYTWASGTFGGQAAYLAMQGDGNLVIYSASDGYLWSPSMGLYPGARLVVQDDGNVVVYSGFTAVWSTNTGGTC